MSIHLVYQVPSSQSGISPFDTAIVDMVSGHDICIACPYLDLDYLHRILKLSCSWRLLTDVEEWLAANHRTDREQIGQFIRNHREHVRHCRGLHAKVVIAEEKALVGSANLTYSGLTEREEVSVLLQDERLVRELHEWFEALWVQASPVVPRELALYIDHIPDLPAPSASISHLTCSVPSVHATLKPLSAMHPIGDDVMHDLVKHLRNAPNRVWIEQYLDLARELVEHTRLSDGDPRLVMSLPQSTYFLPVTINNRYVLTPHRSRHDCFVGIIYGPELDVLPEICPEADRKGRFHHLFGEKVETPFFLEFKDLMAVVLSDRIKEDWLSAAVTELNRADRSIYRKYHQTIVYRTVMDLRFRKEVLGRAFPATAA